VAPGCAPIGGLCAIDSDCCDSALTCQDYRCAAKPTPAPSPSGTLTVNLTAPGTVPVGTTVNVSVTNLETGLPIEGIVIRITSPNGESIIRTTGANGSVSFNASEEGIYDYDPIGIRLLQEKSTYAQAPPSNVTFDSGPSPTPTPKPTPLVTAQASGWPLEYYCCVVLILLVLIVLIVFLLKRRKKDDEKPAALSF